MVTKFAEQQKILIARMTLKLQAAIDKNSYFVGKSSLLTKLDNQVDIHYLLAILNSSMVNYWYANYFDNTHMAGGYLRFDIPYLKQIPIKVIEIGKQEELITLVKKAIENKNSNINADIEKIKKQINKSVYKIYGLSKEEIQIIENETT